MIRIVFTFMLMKIVQRIEHFSVVSQPENKSIFLLDDQNIKPAFFAFTKSLQNTDDNGEKAMLCTLIMNPDLYPPSEMGLGINESVPQSTPIGRKSKNLHVKMIKVSQAISD